MLAVLSEVAVVLDKIPHFQHLISEYMSRTFPKEGEKTKFSCFLLLWDLWTERLEVLWSFGPGLESGSAPPSLCGLGK